MLLAADFFKDALTSGNPPRIPLSVKSLFDNETRDTTIGPRSKQRNEPGSFSSPNEIYDYDAKVEWGSIDHGDREDWDKLNGIGVASI